MSGITDFSPWTIAASLAPTAATINISGRLVTASGRAVSRAIVSITDANGQTKRASSNSFGYIRFTAVEIGDYVVSVKHKTYSFNTNVVNAQSSVDDLVLTGQMNSDGGR